MSKDLKSKPRETKVNVGPPVRLSLGGFKVVGKESDRY